MQNICKKMLALMNDVGAIEKTRDSFQKYKYRGIDDALAALQPLLIKHGVILVPGYTEPVLQPAGEKGFLASTQLHLGWVDADSGEMLRTSFPGVGYDVSDKGIYKAMAGAFKYAVFQTLCIPTEEDKDAEAGEQLTIQNVKVDYSAKVAELEARFNECNDLKELANIRKEAGKLPVEEKNKLAGAYNAAEKRSKLQK
jgi:hypothetical protein